MISAESTKKPRLRALSLGAGVQSSTLALMSARGDLEPLDFAVFADTGWEPAEVYLYLAWLKTQVPFPIIRASRPGLDLGQASMMAAKGEVPRTGTSLPPWYVKDPDGMLPKHCSKEYKTRVVGRVIREKLGLAAGERGPSGVEVESWLGISWDEMQRMKDSEQKFVRNRWPLIELRMNRRDCLRWMEERQYPRPPKSSCIFCPYRGVKQWRDMRDNHPEDWEKAVQFDRDIRPGYAGMEGEAFLLRQRVPLDEADLSTEAERGQIEFGFMQECEGACGV